MIRQVTHFSGHPAVCTHTETVLHAQSRCTLIARRHDYESIKNKNKQKTEWRIKRGTCMLNVDIC